MTTTKTPDKTAERNAPTSKASQAKASASEASAAAAPPAKSPATNAVAATETRAPEAHAAATKEPVTSAPEKLPQPADLEPAMTFGNAAEMNGSLIESYVGASQRMLESALGLNQEVMRFAGERFEADMEALHELSQCTTWPDVMTCQSNFARSALEAYQNEMSKLADLTSRATTETWQPFYDIARGGNHRHAAE